MTTVRAAWLLALVAVVPAACGSAGGSTAAAATPSPPVAVASATTRPTQTPMPARPTPAPSLASTTVPASSPAPGSIAIRMTTGLDLRFEPDTVSAKAGTVVFYLENVPGKLVSPDHNMVIGPALHEELARTKYISSGRAVTFTVQGMAPGKYVFWCSVPVVGGSTEHSASGMVGTLTVTP